MPVVEAKAETSPAMMQITSAASSGVPTRIAACPSRSTAASFCNTPTNVTMPPTRKTVDQSIRSKAACPEQRVDQGQQRAKRQREDADVRLDACDGAADDARDQADHAE